MNIYISTSHDLIKCKTWNLIANDLRYIATKFAISLMQFHEYYEIFVIFDM